MIIKLQNLGKRYNREWIFSGLDYAFETGNAYAITGPNGSGKSTLLQVIAGATIKTEGQVSFVYEGKEIPGEDQFSYISMAAPYLELIEEMTAAELLNFHQNFKALRNPVNDVLETVGLLDARHKQIRYYSSGMKQRLKLAQAFYSETPVLLLDEPTTNLDAQGIMLYKNLVTEVMGKKLIIVCSNDPVEIDFCNQQLSIPGFKTQRHTTRQQIAK